jgi:hypothetical protein
LTPQAPGSSSARVSLMVMPSEDAPPPSTAHRHRGFDVATLDSAEQHEELGFDALPDVYPRHGARLTISIVQLPPPEPDDGCAAPWGARSSTDVTARRRLNAMPVRALDVAIVLQGFLLCLYTCVSSMFMN